MANMLQALEKLDVLFELENALIDTEEDYVTLQKDQMLHAINSDGTNLGIYRNPAYAAKKNQMNPEAGLGNVDLKLTGAFQAGIFADPRPEGIVVDSTDEKSVELQAKYGPHIFGLAEERTQIYINLLDPVLIKNITARLNEAV